MTLKPPRALPLLRLVRSRELEPVPAPKTPQPNHQRVR